MIVAMRADHHRALLDDVLLNQFTAVVRQDLLWRALVLVLRSQQA